MKTPTYILAMLSGFSSKIPTARCRPADGWVAAGPDDLRGPCPMMNTLANHGFLPHDGKNLTQTTVIAALKNGLNFDEDLGSIMYRMAIVANPEPNATYFTLGQLNRHNILEHDASLSRSDAYFGDNHVFNQSIFDTSKAYWTNDEVDAKMLANSKLFRQIQSRAFNPDYTFTNKTEAFSLGEVAAPIVAFGSFETATVQKSLVEYFFENERLPTALGWKKKTDPVTLKNILAMTTLIANATNLITNGMVNVAVSGQDLHGSIGTQQIDAKLESRSKLQTQKYICSGCQTAD